MTVFNWGATLSRQNLNWQIGVKRKGSQVAECFGTFSVQW
jgi:hypothetical protein